MIELVNRVSHAGRLPRTGAGDGIDAIGAAAAADKVVLVVIDGLGERPRKLGLNEEEDVFDEADIDPPPLKGLIVLLNEGRTARGTTPLLLLLTVLRDGEGPRPVLRCAPGA